MMLNHQELARNASDLLSQKPGGQGQPLVSQAHGGQEGGCCSGEEGQFALFSEAVQGEP